MFYGYNLIFFSPISSVLVEDDLPSTMSLIIDSGKEHNYHWRKNIFICAFTNSTKIAKMKAWHAHLIKYIIMF